MVTLEPITKENFKQVIALELEESQKSFVQTNEYSIAQSYVYDEFRPMAICADGIPVGFLLWCIDEDENEFWIYRLMIDKAHQHKGYGTRALHRLVELLQADPDRHQVFISAFPENKAALAAYEKFGFVSAHREINGEVVLKYRYRGDKI